MAWSAVSFGALVRGFVFIAVPLLINLVLTAAHTHVPSDADTAALFCDHAAELCALGKTRELLSRIDGEGHRFDIETEDNMGLFLAYATGIVHAVGIGVHFVLILLIERETKPVLALMPHRQIREYEIASGNRTIEISNSSDRSTGQDRKRVWRRRDTSLGNGARVLKCCVEKELSAVGKGDILLAVKDAQLHNWWWIDGAAVGRGCWQCVLVERGEGKREAISIARHEEGWKEGLR